MNVGSCQQLSCICSDSSTNLVILINLISARLSLNLSANGAWWLVPISLGPCKELLVVLPALGARRRECSLRLWVLWM